MIPCGLYAAAADAFTFCRGSGVSCRAPTGEFDCRHPRVVSSVRCRPSAHVSNRWMAGSRPFRIPPGDAILSMKRCPNLRSRPPSAATPWPCIGAAVVPKAFGPPPVSWRAVTHIQSPRRQIGTRGACGTRTHKQSRSARHQHQLRPDTENQRPELMLDAPLSRSAPAPSARSLPARVQPSNHRSERYRPHRYRTNHG